MKKLLLLIPIVALLFLVGCTAQDQPALNREEFQRQMESQLDEFDQRIERVEEERNRATELSGDARARLDQAIEGLEEQRADLATRLEGMKAVSDEEWETFKPELERASKDLQQAFSDLQGTLEDAVPQN
jgi:hypothetical protein